MINQYCKDSGLESTLCYLIKPVINESYDTIYFDFDICIPDLN